MTTEINGMACIFIFFQVFQCLSCMQFSEAWVVEAGASHGVRKFLFHAFWGFDALLQVSGFVVLHWGIISLKDGMVEAKNANLVYFFIANSIYQTLTL